MTFLAYVIANSDVTYDGCSSSHEPTYACLLPACRGPSPSNLHRVNEQTSHAAAWLGVARSCSLAVGMILSTKQAQYTVDKSQRHAAWLQSCCRVSTRKSHSLRHDSDKAALGDFPNYKISPWKRQGPLPPSFLLPWLFVNILRIGRCLWATREGFNTNRQARKHCCPRRPPLVNNSVKSVMSPPRSGSYAMAAMDPDPTKRVFAGAYQRGLFVS